MALHILKDPERLGACLKVLGPEEALLLIDEAVYLLSPAGGNDLAGCPCPIHVLSADLSLAGLSPDGIGPGTAGPLDYAGWVALTEAHGQQCLWS